MSSLELRNKHLSHAAANRKGESVIEKTARTLVTQWVHARRATWVQLGSLVGNAACFWGTAASPTPRAWLEVALLFPSPAPCRPPSCPHPQSSGCHLPS